MKSSKSRLIFKEKTVLKPVLLCRTVVGTGVSDYFYLISVP